MIHKIEKGTIKLEQSKNSSFKLKILFQTYLTHYYLINKFIHNFSIVLN